MRTGHKETRGQLGALGAVQGMYEAGLDGHCSSGDGERWSDLVYFGSQAGFADQ